MTTMNTPRSPIKIGFFDFTTILWKDRVAIFFATALITAGGFTYALIAEPQYESVSVFIPNTGDGQLQLSSGLSGLAGLAGLNVPAIGDNEESIATLRSHALIEKLIVENSLLPVLFDKNWDSGAKKWKDGVDSAPTVQDGVRLFAKRVRTIELQPGSGLISLSIRWADPDIAYLWNQSLVDLANETLRERDLERSKARLEYLNEQLGASPLLETRQAIARLIESELQTIMLAQADQEYAFRIIDPPRIPEKRVFPKRKLIVLLAGAMGLLFGSAIAVFRWAISKG